jgi:hypothetical protein
MLPEDLKLRAERRARREGLSLGAVVRRALEETLSADQRTLADDPLYSDVAVYQGPVPPDLASRHDGYLYGGQAKP